MKTEEFPPITAETLKMEKGFSKAVKKHQKELEALRKRHLKVIPSSILILNKQIQKNSQKES